MSLIRWNPDRESSWLPSDILDIQREINRMFDGFFRGGTQEDRSLLPSQWTPMADIAEHEDEFLVKLELPGVSKDDVKITLQEKVLTIRGEKKQEKETKKQDYYRMERAYGSFHRSFVLPTSVRGDKIDASYKDGVLTVTLPKAEEARPKLIDVKVK